MDATIKWLIVIPCLFLTSAGLAYAAHDCNDYCSPSDTICQGAWGEIHGDHQQSGVCSNWPTVVGGPAALEGYCNMTWTTLHRIVAETHIKCQGNSCTVEGAMPCGGSAKPYSLTCWETSPGGGGLSDAPQASGGYNFASCRELNGSVTTISCNGSTGNLQTFHGSN